MGIDNTAVILAAFSFITTLVTISVTFIKDRKKAQLSEVQLLISRAMELSKQELEAVRTLNNELGVRVKEQSKEIKSQDERIERTR